MSSSASVETSPPAARSSPPTGKPLRYQDTCLRKSRQPRSSPIRSHRSWACRVISAAHLTQPRQHRPGIRRGRWVQQPGEVAEEPGPSETTPADDHTRAPGGRHHPGRVHRRPHVAVAEDRDVDRVDQRGDRVPTGHSGVVLLGRSPVQGDGRDTGIGGDTTGVEVGEVRVVDAHPRLHRDRHVERPGRVHDRGEDGAEQRPLVGQDRTATLAGDLRHRAAEVQVDVLDAVLRADDPGRRGQRRGVDAVELDRPRAFARVESEHRQRLRVSLDDAARRHHLADEQTVRRPTRIGRRTGRASRALHVRDPCFRLFPAQPAVGGVGDARHRRQDHRQRRRHPSEPQGGIGVRAGGEGREGGGGHGVTHCSPPEAERGVLGHRRVSCGYPDN